MRTIDLRPDETGHAAPITHVAFRPDGERLASCSYDGTVLVWDTTDPAQPLPLTRLRHRRLVNAAAWNPTRPALLATASADKTVAVWRIPDHGPHELVQALARHTDDINSVAWMPDGRRLICVSEDGRATLWDTASGAFLAEISAHAAHCMMVSVSRDGLIATVGEDGMVAVGEPGRPAEVLTRHYTSSVEGCAWSHSGRVLAVARDDGVVILLTPELECLRTVTVSSSAARSVAWADDDSSFVVGAYDGSLHFFGVDGERIRRVDDARMWPRSVATARGLVAAGSFWSGPHLLDLATGTPLSAPERPGHGANALAVLGDELLIGCDSGTVLAIDMDTEEADGEADGTGGTGHPPPSSRPPRLLEISDSPVLSLATRDGSVYAGTYAGHVVRHDGEGNDGARLDGARYDRPHHRGTRLVGESLGAPVPSLCFDGGRLVAGTYSGELIALDPATLTETDRGAPHGGSVKSLSAFGGGFLSAATDRTVAAGSLHHRETLWQHGNLVNAVAGLKGRVVASASRDHTVKVGLLTAGDEGRRVERTQTLLGPDESVKCVALLGDPSSPVVLAGSYDFGLYAWQVDWDDSAGTLASGRLLAEFRQGLSCMIRLDDRRVAVAGWDGRLLIVGQDRRGGVRELRSWDIGELVALAGLSADVGERVAS
ncbi:WD40 repeat domain-containing protein [Streptomyces sp. NPDC091212]|uniref:WD40 repeat domain-containing protein n=1 Tax=Streptomyces sp. NPDC091212 TaxID=3155191 RepID=UPI003436AFF8